MESQQKLKLSEILGFGVGLLPGTANALLAAFLTMFYTDSLKMAAGAVGTMLLVSKLFDGITDLIAGNLIDKTKTKWGKARPWLLWLSVPLGISLALIFFVPINASATGKIIYAFLTYNLFSSILYTMVGVAGNTMMPLMTQNGAERGKLAVVALLFGLGGTILGMSATFPFIFAMGGDVRAWRIVFCVYGAISTLGLLLSFLFTRERVQSVESVAAANDAKAAQTKMTFKEGLKNFVKNKYFLFALFVVLMMNLANNVNSGSQTYFYKYAMNDPMLTTKLNLVNLVPTILSVLFLAQPCLKFLGKKKSVYLGASLQAVSYAIRGIAAMNGNMTLLVAGTVLGALATGPLAIPVNLLVADAVDYGEYITNKRIEGTGSAIVSFSQKVTSGLAAALVGWLLQWTGYVADTQQSAATLAGINTMFAWLPMAILVAIMLGYVLIYRYDKEEAMVLEELENRKKQAGTEN